MYNLEKTKEQVVTLKIVVEGEEFKNVKKEILAKYQNAKVDGFRKGHVPQDVIEKEFAPNIREDLYQQVVNKEFTKALEEKNITPMSKIDVVSENITKEKLEVEITFDATPDFKMPEYKGLNIEEEALDETSEEEVEERLKAMAMRQTVKEVSDKKEAQMGDLVDIDFEGFIDGEAFAGGSSKNFDLNLGSKSFIDNFEEQIAGHKVGDEFEVNVKFPENYHAENLKGKPAMFKVKLNAVKVEKTPELNDEFAKNNNHDTLDALKETIKNQIIEGKKQQIKNAKFQKVADELVKKVEMTIPKRALEAEKTREVEEFKKQLANYGQDFKKFLENSSKTEEEFEKDSLERAETTIKFRLIASNIIETEKLNVSDEEIDENLSQMATQYGLKLEDLKNQLVQMNMYENYVNEMANNIVTEKLKTFLVENN